MNDEITSYSSFRGWQAFWTILAELSGQGFIVSYKMTTEDDFGVNLLVELLRNGDIAYTKSFRSQTPYEAVEEAAEHLFNWHRESVGENNIPQRDNVLADRD